MDPELLAGLRSKFLRVEVEELLEAELEALLREVRTRFVHGSAGRWWWESPITESVTLDYAGSDGLEWLGRLLGTEERVWIVVTDDEDGPWPAFRGTAGAIRAVLENERFFEYFLVGEEGEWVVFDTHHNTLVVVGALVGAARSLA